MNAAARKPRKPAPASSLPIPALSKTKPLPRDFFTADTVSVARALLGKIMVSDSPEGRTAGRIVETEAYLCDDAACHASRGPTLRNQAMFGPAGRSYTYLIYGMYKCFNVTTAPPGVGEAVLIRALEPLEGSRLMANRRGTDSPKALCSGPGKLVIALGIGDLPNGSDLRKGNLRILDTPADPGPARAGAQGNILVTTRIGITKDAHLPLRFYLAGNPFISRK
jgi:DNA-3-methyladenine glycosylase